MHDPVYRSDCRHRVGEGLLPLGEDQVLGNQVKVFNLLSIRGNTRAHSAAGSCEFPRWRDYAW